MRILCLTCEALARPAYHCAALSPHIVDVVLVERGLHHRPGDLREMLQQYINAASPQRYNYVTLAYGLCGKATAGLSAATVPLVIPRVHDCISLFLGSRQRYQEQFEQHPGTYWYAQDYIERAEGTATSLSMGSDFEEDIRKVYDEYVRKYGQDNADYLMEVMGAWQQHYQRAVFIEMGISNGTEVETRAREEALRRGWTFERMAGDLLLIRRLLFAEWENNDYADFLVLQPGQKVTMSYDEHVIRCDLII